MKPKQFTRKAKSGWSYFDNSGYILKCLKNVPSKFEREIPKW